MKVGWGIGVVIAVLASLAAFFFGLFGTLYSPSALYLLAASMLSLSGIWTVLSGFLVVEAKDRTYYSVWGVVMFCLSLFAFLPPAYAAGILIVAIIVLILLVIYEGSSQKLVAAGTNPRAPPGGSPAAGFT